jgi:hypothetical protein
MLAALRLETPTPSPRNRITFLACDHAGREAIAKRAAEANIGFLILRSLCLL